jgi:hypothetical protein
MFTIGSNSGTLLLCAIVAAAWAWYMAQPKEFLWAALAVAGTAAALGGAKEISGGGVGGPPPRYYKEQLDAMLKGLTARTVPGSSPLTERERRSITSSLLQIMTTMLATARSDARYAALGYIRTPGYKRGNETLKSAFARGGNVLSRVLQRALNLSSAIGDMEAAESVTSQAAIAATVAAVAAVRPTLPRAELERRRAEVAALDKALQDVSMHIAPYVGHHTPGTSLAGTMNAGAPLAVALGAVVTATAPYSLEIDQDEVMAPFKALRGKALLGIPRLTYEEATALLKPGQDFVKEKREEVGQYSPA